jgi:hypothetical protein
MPLKRINQGLPQEVSECPLGKFKVDSTGISGSYNNDPVEKCFNCNFGNLESKATPPSDEVCMCPPNLTWNEYDQLRENYYNSGGEKSRKSFWKFVNENYKSKN